MFMAAGMGVPSHLLPQEHFPCVVSENGAIVLPTQFTEAMKKVVAAQVEAHPWCMEPKLLVPRGEAEKWLA